ncbi:hypothetical protein ACU8KH_05250 [Lachancea thermotolerans]|uniref:KLTH0G15290p n=1 Tax=Lachancea thermotolerans (strain ATCC 56472 / CBS 6340 / NRRL Y-8284) TaxID=559295 RepID=C5DNA0_LACTC|nr:KLTH0G15290p [Lachancea thermotolerans CBS 6340]CAR25261.1 KLTH0G15290p [Lachancea thermotolerans CBS 6340]
MKSTLFIASTLLSLAAATFPTNITLVDFIKEYTLDQIALPVEDGADLWILSKDGDRQNVSTDSLLYTTWSESDWPLFEYGCHLETETGGSFAYSIGLM